MKTDLFRPIRTVWWEEKPVETDEIPEVAVGSLDQSLLPQQVVSLLLTHEQQVAEAIKTLKVRGAPAIGVTAAYGLALAMCRFWRECVLHQQPLSLAEACAHLDGVAALLARTRPTAVNLFWALRRMQAVAEQHVARQVALAELVHVLHAEAQAIADEDVAACLRMGQFGAELISDGA